jgi:hypothetical protein
MLTAALQLLVASSKTRTETAAEAPIVLTNPMTPTASISDEAKPYLSMDGKARRLAQRFVASVSSHVMRAKAKPMKIK